MSIKVTLPTAFTRHTDGRKHFDSAPRTFPALSPTSTRPFPLSLRRSRTSKASFAASSTSTSTMKISASLGGETYAFQDGDEIMLIPSIAGGTA